MKQNNIKIYRNFTDEFCIKMCKYFADKSIIKELDNQLYSNDRMTWFIYEENNIIMAFLSIDDYGDCYYLDNFYVLPEYRNIGIGNNLLDYALNYFNNKEIRLISRNDIAIDMYIKRGFKIYTTKGRYKYLYKDFKEEN